MDLVDADASWSAASARVTRASISRASFIARNLATSERASASSRSPDAPNSSFSDDPRVADETAAARSARRASTDDDAAVVSARMSRATSAASRSAGGAATIACGASN